MKRQFIRFQARTEASSFQSWEQISTATTRALSRVKVSRSSPARILLPVRKPGSMAKSLAGFGFRRAQNRALPPTRMIERVAPGAARSTTRPVEKSRKISLPGIISHVYRPPLTTVHAPAPSRSVNPIQPHPHQQFKVCAVTHHTQHPVFPVLQQNRSRRPFRPSPNGYPYRALPTPSTPHRFSPQTSRRPPSLLPRRSRRRSRQVSPIWIGLLLGFLALFIVLSGAIFAYYQFEIAPSLRAILGNKAWREHMPDSSLPVSELNRTINILLLGSDTDGKNNDPERGQAPLAQTIMIVTINPQSHYVGMLSIPRDIQVTDERYVQRELYPKLDEVFMHAFEPNGLSVADRVSRAAGHTMDVIEQNYGIRIDHYAWVGLKGFIKVIDTAGGVDVDVIHPMLDDTYPDDINNPKGSIYDYKRLHIAPGPQHLNGVQALEYVRTRHSDLIGDFGRTIRQQQVLSQLKQKLTTSDIISKAPQYLRDLTGSLYTDMSLADIISLGNYARDVDLNQVERVTLAPPLYAIEGTARPGNFLPVCKEVNRVISKMFQIPPACLPQGELAAPPPNSSIPPATPTLVQPTPTPLVIPTPVPTPSPAPTKNVVIPTVPPEEQDEVAGIQRLLGLVSSVACETLITL